MPALHNLVARTTEVVAVKVYGVAATVCIQTSGTAVAPALIRGVATLVVYLDSPAACTPTRALARATVQSPVLQCFVGIASNIMAIQVDAVAITVVVQASRPP